MSARFGTAIREVVETDLGPAETIPAGGETRPPERETKPKTLRELAADVTRLKAKLVVHDADVVAWNDEAKTRRAALKKDIASAIKAMNDEASK